MSESDKIKFAGIALCVYVAMLVLFVSVLTETSALILGGMAAAFVPGIFLVLDSEPLPKQDDEFDEFLKELE